MTKNVAFGYDFDETLSEETGQMPFLRHFLPNLKKKYGIERAEEYWKLCDDSDFNIAWLQQVAKDAPECFPGLTNQALEEEFAPKIPLAPGVEEWFDMINEYCQEFDLNPSHHVISASVVPLISGTSIAKHLNSICAGEFHDDGGVIHKVKRIIGPHDKVRRLKEIAKGADLYDDLPIEEYAVNYNRFCIFGDGLSDIDMFRYLQEDGAQINAVYKADKFRAYIKALHKLVSHVSLIAPRDFRKESYLEKEVKLFLQGIANDECDMDFDLVHRMKLGQIKFKEVEKVVREHYKSCDYCKGRRVTKVFF